MINREDMNQNRDQVLNLPVELLKLPNVVIKETLIDKENRIILLVESLEKGTPCYKCGREVEAFHGHGEEIVLRHLPLSGNEMFIGIEPKRYHCKDCEAVTTQRLSWYPPRCSHTNAYEDHILLQLINSTVSDVCIKEQFGYEAVMGIIKRRLEVEIDWSKVERLDTIGIDEITLKKGHQDYVTIVTGRIGDKLLILGVLKDKEKATVKAFLKSIPKRIRRQVKAVCSDMYEGFINAVKEVFSKKVKIVVDRFHVAKLYRGCVDNLRMKELKRLKKELPEEEYKKLKGVMWLLRKREEDLKVEDKETLRLLFKHSPALKFAYESSNELTAIFNANLSKFQAKHKINSWIRRMEKSSLNCFKTFIKTLTKFKDKITNYFIDRNTSGFVEGFNNKIKAIKRRCYGILNIDHLFQRIYLDTCGFSLFLPRTENQGVTP
jgi:transposase